MNSVILMGRLVRDPEIRYSSGGDSSFAVARYRIAVDRRFKREGQPDADFFDCVVFGRQVEFVEKYLRQGTKMVIQGRLQNDNYTDKDGRTVYRNQIVVENQEFAESKAASAQNSSAYRGSSGSYQQGGNYQQNNYQQSSYQQPAYSQPNTYQQPAPAPMPVQENTAPPAREERPAPDTSADGFMNIPDSIDEELPFN